MKHCLVFASLISPSKMILFEKKYQTFDTVFHHQMKHCISCLIYYIKTRRKPVKKWVILIALQFRYTFYRPQTKRQRARKIGLQYKIRKDLVRLFTRHFVPRSPFGRRPSGTLLGDVPCASENMACDY